MRIRHPFLAFVFKHRTELLMWVFIFETLASPIADTHPHVGAVLGITVLVFVVLGVNYIGDRKIARIVVIPAACAWLFARILEAFGDRTQIYAQLAPVAGLILSCAILWAIFDHFNSVPRAPRSAIAEAFISYLVIAKAFSQLYWILNRVLDHPFNQTIGITESGELLYFSMITLTGVGYGGIIPVNPYLRLIAAMENMAGIFFVAVVVARLVSSYRATPRPQEHNRVES